jgi:hypothetical protein
MKNRYFTSCLLVPVALTLALSGTSLAQNANFTTTFLTTGTFGTSPALTGVANANPGGARMLWYPRKAAFRAGSVSGTQWNDLSIGNYSTAFGQNTTALGANATALGNSTSASGVNSIASGANSIASGGQSTALGNGTTAPGDSSTSMGIGTKAGSIGSTAIGRYNTGLGSATVWNATEPIFEIGNGTSPTALSNALTVLKNGNTTIAGTLTSGAITASAVNTSGNINLTGTNGAIFANGTSLLSVNSTTNAVSFAANRPFSISNSTPSTSPTTGALTVAGGLGVSGAINANADSYINGLRVGRGSSNSVDSVVLGFGSLSNPSTTGYSNIAIGYSVLPNVTSGYWNTAIGQYSQQNTTSGRDNTAIGYQSMFSNSTGVENNAFGSQSMRGNTTGYANNAFGSAALLSNTTGIYNSAFGANSLQNIIGSNNVGIGAYAGYLQADGTPLTAASNSTYIGANSRGKNNADNNSIVIGSGAIGEGANTTVIGNSSMIKTLFYGKVIHHTTGTVAMGVYGE